MSTQRVWKWIAAILLLQLGIGCSKGRSSEQVLDAAKAAILAAEQADAGTYAPWHLRDAREALSRAEGSMERASVEKEANKKAARIKTAKTWAERAKEKAELALTEAAKNKAIFGGRSR